MSFFFTTNKPGIWTDVCRPILPTLNIQNQRETDLNLPLSNILAISDGKDRVNRLIIVLN